MGAVALQAATRYHGVALIARWLALNGFLKDNPDSAWIARESEGGPPLASAALFEAAAVQPVIDRDGEVVFERQSYSIGSSSWRTDPTRCSRRAPLGVQRLALFTTAPAPPETSETARRFPRALRARD